jgi:Flp pilus assembly protein TadD
MDIKTKEVLFAGMFIIIGAIISPLVTVLLSSSNMPPVIVDFSSDLASPQPNNTSITWIANARDPNNDYIYYKFKLKGPSTENLWEDKQDWSQRNSWTWHAIGSDIGNNTIRVLVRDNKHVMTEIGDDDKSDTYTITKSSRDWYNEANALLNQRKYDEAIQACDSAIQINPQVVGAWNIKGLALYNQSKYDEAIQAYNRAIQIDPQYAEAWNNKGNALYHQGKYEEAIQALDSAIQINPLYADAWDLKGNVLYTQGKYDEAIQACDRAVQINPQDANAWYLKGYALKLLNRTTEADDAFAKARN